MNPPSVSLVLLCVLNVWNGGSATGCGEQQFEVDGECCDQCLPGQYLKTFCTKSQPTVCSPCGEGYFSDRYNNFDRCKKCQLCSQEYTEKCTPTTDAKCSCRNGFLCSNNACSKCEENKCVTGEKVKMTENSTGGGLVEYSYECEPLCPDNEYFDEKEGVCQPRAKCSVFGFAEQFPGNKTHNSICSEKSVKGMDKVHAILAIGFLLLSLTLLVLLSYALIKRLMKFKTYDNSTDVTTDIAVFTKPSEVHLSQEECGLKLIIKEEIKVGDNPSHLHLEQETMFG